MTSPVSVPNPLSQSAHGPPLRMPDAVLTHVGWLGQTGAVYGMDDPPYDVREPGGFAPLYMRIGTWQTEPGTDHLMIKD